ncbi:MAG: Bax inhibitor-1/YccA family protein [SAR86 cluster bacterium]|jgi:uncharacterized YccA/Bax inhibitor family protein|nr:Bax inhibitor-1/YccA family protein [SAR86 cluster bacterium]HIA42595.1 Bax inhibitor-1/YccA family protein [Gammaproteobacteria bacterium]
MSRHGALNTFGRSGNPIIRSDVFTSKASSSEDRMTLNGAVNKTGILLFLTVLAATISWNFQGPFMLLVSIIGMFTAFIVGIATFGFWFFFVGWLVKPRPYLAPKTAPIYALGMGFLIGLISEQMESQFPGIVIQAVSLTFFVAASLLLAYKTGLIKPTQNFWLIVFSATVGILLTYIVNIFYSMFTGASFSFLTGNGMFGIGISLFVVAIASLNLVLDFDIIEQADEQGAPKYVEWFGAMALVATLIWLYIEILRLLSKLRR